MEGDKSSIKGKRWDELGQGRETGKKAEPGQEQQRKAMAKTQPRMGKKPGGQKGKSVTVITEIVSFVLFI